MTNSLKTGVVIVTNRTPIYEALAEMTRAFFAYFFERGAGEITQIVFSNHSGNTVTVGNVIVTHRTPGPMLKVQNAFRAAWAVLGANQKLTVTFRIEPIYESGDDNE